MIGTTVYEFLISRLGNLRGAKALSLFRPPATPMVQQRIKSSPAIEEIVRSAVDLRARTNLPFWDAVNVSSFDRVEVAPELLAEALFHNRSGPSLQRVPIAGLTPRVLAELCQDHDQEVTVLSSAIEMEDGSRRHLPMLDFHAPASKQNLPLVVAAARKLHSNGAILKSGKSYHFYGLTLLSESENIDHLARALLLAPIVDRAWIAHQLLERACGLRISTRDERHVPIVAAEF